MRSGRSLTIDVNNREPPVLRVLLPSRNFEISSANSDSAELGLVARCPSSRASNEVSDTIQNPLTYLDVLPGHSYGHPSVLVETWELQGDQWTVVSARYADCSA